MKKFKKEQFEMFRLPILSGRFHPHSIGAIGPAVFFFMVMFIIAPYLNNGNTIYCENISLYLQIYKIVLAILIIAWLIFLNKKLAIKYQKIQFLTWIAQMISLAIGLIYFSLTIIAENTKIPLKVFSNLKLGVLIILGIVFVIAFIVVLNRIKNNYYVVTHNQIRNLVNIEKRLMKPLGSGIILLLASVSLFVSKLNLRISILIFSGLFLILTANLIILMIPTNIITAYCKFKYKDFNVNK